MSCERHCVILSHIIIILTHLYIEIAADRIYIGKDIYILYIGGY